MKSSSVLGIFFVLVFWLRAGQAQEILNGGFENGLTNWTVSKDFMVFTKPERAHNGTQYAYTGVNSSLTTPLQGTLSQLVSIPPSAASADLEFYLWVTSDEPGANLKADVLQIQFLTPAGDYLRAEALTFSNLDKSGALESTNKDYKRCTVSLSTYIGPTIRIQFKSTVDSSFHTIFRIDDVAVTVVSKKPNLTPYKPQDWSDKIVISKRIGTSSDDPNITSSDTIYVDWSYINNGGVKVPSLPRATLYLDDQLVESLQADRLLEPQVPTARFDLPLGPLTQGTHSLKLVVDPAGSIDESDESVTDNQYVRYFTVGSPPSPPNLAFYQPPGWPDKLVLSTSAGSSTATASATTADSLFLDYAFRNGSSSAIGKSFSITVSVDGVVHSTRLINPPSEELAVSDVQLGRLSAGIRVITVKLDSSNEISELSESDNLGEVTILITDSNDGELSMTSPARNSSWAVGGATVPLRWSLSSSVSGVTGFRALFKANGTTFDSGPLAPTARSFDWTVPSFFANSAVTIRLEALGTTAFVEVPITTIRPADNSVYAVITLPPDQNPKELNPKELPLNRAVTFSGADSLGSVAFYTWLFSDGTIATGSNLSSVQHTFSKALEKGNGWVELRVSSPTGNISTAAIAFALQGSGPPHLSQNGSSNDPINTATGSFLLGLDLMPIQARGLPFLFQAYYSSQSYRPAIAPLSESRPGSLGYGWSHSFETSVSSSTENGIRVALISFGDGHSEKYTFSSDSRWQASPGIFSVLEEDTGGKFTLITHTGLRHRFDSKGRLAGIVDRNANELTIVWEEKSATGDPDDKRIQKVVLPGGPINGTASREIKFHYRPDAPSFLWKLEDPMQHFIVFTQDGKGDLRSWENEEHHVTSYTYGALHQLETGTDAKNQRFVLNRYNSDRRADRQEDASGNVTILEYGLPDTGSSENQITRITRLADPSFALADTRNEVTEDTHDANLRLVKRSVMVEDPDQHGVLVPLTQKWKYDGTTGEVTSSTNRRGLETKFQWQNGNLTRKTTPDKGITSYAYGDPLNPNLPTLITYPDPRVVRKLDYDAKGNLGGATFPYDPANPDMNHRTQVPDEFGQIISMTDANKISQSFENYQWGRNWAQIDGELKRQGLEYDANGLLSATIDPRQNRVEFKRNGTGAIIRTLRNDPNDPEHPIISEIEYDENEQVVLTTYPLSRHFHTRRDVQGRVWQEEDNEGHKTTHRFDAFSREFETENAKGGVTRRAYNLAGYLMSVASPAPSTNVIRYRRDENGNVMETIDGDGVRMTFEYDEMDRQVVARRWKSATESEEVRTSYNLMGQKEWDMDEEGRKTQYFYDLAGNHVRTVPVEGPEFTFGYDNEGHQTSATHDGDRKREDKFTGRYQLKERKDENGNAETFGYDAAGNLEKHVNADLQESGFVHDSLNRLTRINPPTGPPAEFKYDRAGQRLKMSDSIGTTEWTYTSLGQVESITAPNSLQLAFHYDELGATDRITYPGNRVAQYRYDTAGRFESVMDWSNRTIRQTYTTGDRLLHRSYPNTVASAFGHDSEGRVGSITHQKASEPALLTLAYKFNKLGQLSELPDISIDPNEPDYPRTYGKANELLTIAGTPVIHDKRGNIIQAKFNPFSPAADTLTWDYANRLTGGTVSGAAFTNSFNGLGQRVTTTRNGRSTGFLMDDRPVMPRIMAELDSAGNPSAFNLYAGDILLSRILPDGTAMYYHGDRQGNIVLVTDGNGSSAALYQYDPFGVQISASGPAAASNPFGYLGGLGVYDNGDGTLHARARTYHPKLGRFLSRDALYGENHSGPSLNRYVYALNDPFGFSDPSGFKPVNGILYSDLQAALSNGALIPLSQADSNFGQTWYHTTLDVIGLVPIFGEFADVANGATYLAQEDYLNAGLSFAGAIPFGGWAATGGKYVVKYGDDAAEITERLGSPAVGKIINLTEQQMSNLARFNKKLPSANLGTVVDKLGEGVLFTSTVPGKVPGSSAVYQKFVDALGNTGVYVKTTFDQLGRIVHIKDKLN